MSAEQPAGRCPGRVLVVEPNMTGHRFNYVRILVAECGRQGREVTVLTTPSGREEYLAKTEGAVAPAWSLIPAGTRPGPELLETVSRQAQATTVVVPDGDRMALRFARRPRWRGSGELRILIMRAYAQSGRRPWLAPVKTLVRRAGFAVTKAIPRVSVLVLGSALGGHQPLPGVVADPIEYAPAADVGEALRREAAIDPARFWFGVAGWIDARKNVPLVLAALTKASASSERPLGLLLTGRHDPEVVAAVEAFPAGEVRIASVDRHLTATELDSAIEIADCLVLAHSNEGPSGILGKAAAAGKKIIAAGARTLRDDCRGLGPSAQWVELDVDALAQAALRAIVQPPAATVAVASPSDFAASLLGDP